MKEAIELEFVPLQLARRRQRSIRSRRRHPLARARLLRLLCRGDLDHDKKND